jgi:hypothetical protein
MEEPTISIERPHRYLWRFLSLFGEECYKTWRQELLASVIASIATFGITWLNDTLAWSTLRTALFATALTLAVFALWHLLRTPWLLTHPRAKRHNLFGLIGAVVMLCLIAGFTMTAVIVVRHWKIRNPEVTQQDKTPPAPQKTTPAPVAPEKLHPPQRLFQVNPKSSEPSNLPNLKFEAPVTQKNDGPCGINNIGGIVSGNTCVTTPPQRTIDKQALERAVSILKKAPSGSKFNIVVINGNDETDKLADQIQQMLIGGKWEQQNPRQDTKVDGTINGRRLIVEGVTCDFGKTEVLSHKFAEDAMAAAGYPCQSTVPEYTPRTEIIHGEPYTFEKVLADIYIKVAPAAPITKLQ